MSQLSRKMSDSDDRNAMSYEGQNEIQTKMDVLREDIRKGNFNHFIEKNYKKFTVTLFKGVLQKVYILLPTS